MEISTILDDIGNGHMAIPEIRELCLEPLAFLLSRDSSMIEDPSAAGYRCFRQSEQFKSYVKREVLA